jgi:membrane protein implicated in regulation of membrane protease activity
MPAWGWWLLVAAVLVVCEALSLTLVLVLVALGAAAAAGVAALGGDLFLQTAAFSVTSLALLVLVRPVARRHRRMPAALRTGADALVGVHAQVVDRVDRYHGQVRLRGEIWSARLCEGTADSDVLEPGASVRVLAIDGATALVYPTDA